MSAETLRRTVALMQERVSGATSGPWVVGVDPESGERNVIYSEFIATRYANSDPTVARIISPQCPESDDEREAEWGQTADAEHIAAWSPEVADALADLLSHLAADIEDDDLDGGTTEAALAFARAYLGGSV